VLGFDSSFSGGLAEPSSAFLLHQEEIFWRLATLLSKYWGISECKEEWLRKGPLFEDPACCYRLQTVLFMSLVILVFEGYCWRQLLKLAHSVCHCSTSIQSRTHVTRPASPSTPPVKNTTPSSGTKRPGGEDSNPLSQQAQRQGASTGLLCQGAQRVSLCPPAAGSMFFRCLLCALTFGLLKKWT
jgi:hypothetical protein